MNKKILLTAIGSFSADAAVKSLKNIGFQVFGCDIYPSEWHAVSQECNAVFRAPLATDDNYIPFLLDLCRQNEIGYLVPLTDLEIDVINNNRKSFKQANVVVCIPSPEALSIARDKYHLYQTFLEDSEVPSILTYKSGEIDFSRLPLPAIAKPYNGRSSEGLQRIVDESVLASYNQKEGYIIQECIEGPVFTVDYVRNSVTGSDVAIARQELLRTKNGAGVTVKMIEDNKLVALVKHIGSKLDINGCVNMEFISHNGKYYLIDINPRFSAGVAFSSVVGYDMVKNHLYCFLHKEIDSQIEYKTSIVTKRYKEEVLWVE